MRPAETLASDQEAPETRADGGATAHRRPGRPRSEQAERAIIAAALDLFAESGPDGLCMERVAARAGVGKATIYRRWPGKEDLLLDALASLKTPLPEPKGRSVREDLVAVLDAMCEMARFAETVVEPRREVVRSVLRRGVATGELREDADIEVALFMLRGASLASTMHGQEPIEDYAKRVVDEMLRGLAAR